MKVNISYLISVHRNISKTDSRAFIKMAPEVTKTLLNKIILNVWIENGPVL
jgi:hypothetical protein